MKITIEPTPELFDAPINGVLVPTRIWRGLTTGGAPCDVYVLAVVPDDGYVEQFQRESAGLLQPVRDIMKVDLSQ